MQPYRVEKAFEAGAEVALGVGVVVRVPVGGGNGSRGRGCYRVVDDVVDGVVVGVEMSQPRKGAIREESILWSSLVAVSSQSGWVDVRK